MFHPAVNEQLGFVLFSESSSNHSPIHHSFHQQHPDNFLLHPHSDPSLANQMIGSGPGSLNHHHNRGINPYLGFDWSTSLLSASVAAAASAAAVAASSSPPMPMSMPTPVSSPSRLTTFPLSPPPGCFLAQSEHMHSYHNSNALMGHHHVSTVLDPDPLISVGSAFLGMGSSTPVGLGAGQKGENTQESSGDSGGMIMPMHPDRDL